MKSRLQLRFAKNRGLVIVLFALVALSVTFGLLLFWLSPIEKPAFEKQLFGEWEYKSNQVNLITSYFKKSDTDISIKIERENTSLQFVYPFQNTTIQNENNTLKYRSSNLPIEAHYVLIPNGIKEELILHKIPQQSTFTTRIQTQGLIPKINSSNIIAFYTSKGEYQFHFERPFVKDAEGSVSYDVKYHLKKISGDKITNGIVKTDEKVTIPLYSSTNQVNSPTLNPTEDAYVLEIEVDPSWLHDSNRKLPITIDPTVVHDTTSEFAGGDFNGTKDVGTGSTLTSATGGVITTSGDYIIHTFTGSGTFTPNGTGNVEVLVVAGGGGGANTGSGGGGGGFIFNPSFQVTAQSYPVTVGNGGIGGQSTSAPGQQGGNSIFSSLTAIGGGAGASHGNSAGGNGGSGGGAPIKAAAPTASGGTATAGQGNVGGAGYVDAGWVGTSGGGGGAGTAGSAGGNSAGSGNGGNGLLSCITGTCTYYAGGGGGSEVNGSFVGTGGLGGGGNAVLNSAGGDGTANTGGGGAGGAYNGGVYTNGGNGGSGIVVIRYKTQKIESYFKELTSDQFAAGLWHLNEPSGNTIDSSPNGNNGTATGTLVGEGIYGSARRFNGSSDTISTPLARGKNNFTIEMWVKPYTTHEIDTEANTGTTGSTGQKYVYWNGGWNSAPDAGVLISVGTNGVSVYEHTGGYMPPLLVYSGTLYDWTHIAVVYDNRTPKLYINGELKRIGLTSTMTNVYAYAGGGWGETNLFKLGGGAYGYFNGEIDEVRVSDTIRTSEEIKSSASRKSSAIYTSDMIDLTDVDTWNTLTWTEGGVQTGDGETPYNSSNLIAHWKLNQSSGTTATNNAGSCGATCNGTLGGFSNTSARDVVAGSGWTQHNRRWGEGALAFDGLDDVVTIGDVTQFDGLTQLTVSAWIYPKYLPTGSIYDAIIAKANYTGAGNAFFLRITDAEGVRFAVRDAGSNQINCDTGVGVMPPVGQWTHIVATLTSDDKCFVYFNGIQKATGSNTAFTTVQNTTTALKIGSSDYASEQWFEGIIDSVSIYSRAWSPAEVISNYNVGALEIQTRVGNSANPDDGSWEAWKPASSESLLDSLESYEVTTRVYKYAVGDNTTNQTWIKKNNNIPNISDTTSTDGRIAVGNAGRADSVAIIAPTVLLDNNTYKIWYHAGDGQNARILYATSPDGLTWTKYDNTIPTASDTTGTNGRIPQGTAGKGDSLSAGYPNIIKDGNTYKMWYSGNDGSTWRIFYATSPDGLTWTKYDNTIPTASDTTGTNGRIPLGTAGKGDQNGTLRASVVKDGNTYKMWYSGLGANWQIFYATSPDGLTWTKYDNTIPTASDTVSTNGRIAVGTNGSADSAHVYESSVIKDGNSFKLWYNGHTGANVRILYATSPDGLTWTKYDNTIPTASDTTGTNGRIPLGTLGDLTHSYSPSVIKVRGQYKLWYAGNNSNWSIYHATMTPLPSQQSIDTTIKTEGNASTMVTTGVVGDAGTVALWKLDETSGTGAYLKDSGPNGYHATPVNATLARGISSRARSVNAPGAGIQTDYIDTGINNSPAKFTNAFSAEAWIKPTAFDAAHNTIAGQETGFLFAFNSIGQVANYVYAGGGWTAADGGMCNITLNKWQHVAMTYDGTNLKSYLNGEQCGGGTARTGTMTSASNIYIGMRAPGGTKQPMHGLIDEVHISKITRTAEEIAENYRIGSRHYLSYEINSSNLQNKSTLPFMVAADRPGTYLKASIGENPYVNNQPDNYTVGLWHLDEENNIYPKSCYSLKLKGFSTDGIYTIDPDGEGGDNPIRVYCNMTYDGGGWTMMVKSWYGSGLIGNSSAVGSVTDATTLKGNPYKLSDISIRNIIGPSNNFDVMVDQNGYNSLYSTGNYEYVVLRNYTGKWTYETAMPASTTTTTFQSYRASDNALAWTGNIICGYDAGTGAAGINCYGGLGVTNNPQGGAGCVINMGTASNAGWYHFFMNQYNDDTYIYICNGAQHSSGQNMNHRFWVRERYPVVAVAKDSSGRSNSPDTLIATGGTISSANGYTIHKFTSSGTFQVVSGVGTVEALVVGGGGGGGMDMGGGGGGGGVVFDRAFSVSPQSYPVTVGLGGAGAPAAGTGGQPAAHPYSINAQNGQNSVFGTNTAYGGGFGGSSYYGYAPLYGTPNSGASGGGASGYSDTTIKAGGTATQHNVGGQGGGQYYSGGGGGAGLGGTNSPSIAHGGAGKRNSALGPSYYWGGGGGGAGYSICGGNGGDGGGGGAAVCTTTGGSGLNAGSAGGGGSTGSQTNTPGGNGGANTGGGGGGGSHYNANNKGGDGGSGIVVIRYPNASYVNQRDGQVVGATLVQGKIGKARYFNRTTDYIEIANSPSTRVGSPNLTFDAWINPTSHTNCGADGNPVCIIANKENSYEWAISNTGKLHWAISNTSPGWAWVNTGVILPINTWSHIALVYDGNEFKTYLNGTLAHNSVATGNINNNQNNLRIGARGAPGVASSFFHGIIDEVRLSNVSRSPEEIRQVYELGNRSYTITIDFGAKLDGGDLISNSEDFTFNVDATIYGIAQKGDKIYTGDKIIVRENYNGVEYKAQGTITSVIPSTGAVTVSAWDANSTFPAVGYSAEADVFKWQREYWNITQPFNSIIDNSRLITFQFTDGNEGRTVWIDDLRAGDEYLTNPLGSTITSSSGSRYFQYRAIFHSADNNVSANLSTVSLQYTVNTAPNTPLLNSPTNSANSVSRTPTLYTTAIDPNDDFLRYKITLCTDSNMTQNCQTFDQTSSQTNWGGQSTQNGTAYLSGNQASYTVTTPLNYNTTYYWKSYAIDPEGANAWSGTQVTPFSFTTTTIEPPTNCKVTRTNNTNVIEWTDNATSENGFAIQRSVNGGGWTNLNMSMNANTVSFIDSPVQNNTTYQYRVASYLTGPQYSAWCTTTLQSINVGTLKFEGNFNFSGIEVQ